MAHRARSPKNGKGNNPYGDALAQQEEIEQAAKARAAGIKAGHNSGEVPEDTLRLHTDTLRNKKSAIDALMKQVSELRQELSNAKTLAKKDKVNVKGVMAALALEKAARENGSSGIVEEHRTIGRVLKILDCPLGHQFHLFDLPETDQDGAKIDAALQGEQAGREGAPKDDNPHTPGTPDWFSWNNGHQVGADAAVASFGGSATGEAAH